MSIFKIIKYIVYWLVIAWSVFFFPSMIFVYFKADGAASTISLLIMGVVVATYFIYSLIKNKNKK